MKTSTLLATSESASSDPKAVRRRELARTWLVALAMLLTLLLVGALVLGEGLGGNLFYQR